MIGVIALEYRLIRSRRKTLSVEIKGGEVVVRAPERLSKARIDAFLDSRRAWIEKQLEKSAELAAVEPISAEELEALARSAKEYIPARVGYYAQIVGVTYGRITIRAQRTKWGSCSGRGNLNFNCLLMLTPPEVRDAVIVHELCHLREMNHSPRFYSDVRRAYPEYDKWNRWLRENGGAIISRLEKIAEV